VRRDAEKLQGFNQMLAARVEELEHSDWADRAKLHELCSAYDQRIGRWGCARGSAKADTLRSDLSSAEKMRHLRWMLEQIPNLRNAGKVNRWLGFVQGVLFEMRMYTIDELRKHVTEARG
jgi:hypothetical protein